MAKSSNSEHSDVEAMENRRQASNEDVRLVELWVPDVSSDEFKAEAYRQSLIVANSPSEADDQAFIDSTSEFFARSGDEPDFID